MLVRILNSITMYSYFYTQGSNNNFPITILLETLSLKGLFLFFTGDKDKGFEMTKGVSCL